MLKNFKTAYVIVFALFLCTSCASPNHEDSHSSAPQNITKHSDVTKITHMPYDQSYRPPYRLGTNDKIRLLVFGEEDLSDVYTIAPNGMLSIPLIGQVPARDKTIHELQTTIEQRLADGYLVNPSISLEIAAFRPFYILGEVTNPGSYPYENDMTILKAVALAGGFTYRADRDTIKIVQSNADGTKTYTEHPSQTRFAPGDIILVEERFF